MARVTIASIGAAASFDQGPPSGRLARRIITASHLAHRPGILDRSTAHNATKQAPGPPIASLAMTSYILGSVQDRPESYPPLQDRCAFCNIIRGKSEAYVAYEDEDCIAFLDIYPMRPGHTLLVPKHHYARLSDLPPELGAAMGRALPRITKALTEATENKDLNVVCNQGYAQAVHVHWHLIPAPILTKRPEPVSRERPALTHMQMLMGEMANRDYLEPEEAEVLVRQIRSKL